MNAPTKQASRKALDATLLALNSLGLSLSTIAKKTGFHSSTVTQRINKLGAEPADTRRAFMEDIYNGLTEDQRDWLIGAVAPHTNIKNYMRHLLVREYLAAQKGTTEQ